MTILKPDYVKYDIDLEILTNKVEALVNKKINCTLPKEAFLIDYIEDIYVINLNGAAFDTEQEYINTIESLEMEFSFDEEDLSVFTSEILHTIYNMPYGTAINYNENLNCFLYGHYYIEMPFDTYHEINKQPILDCIKEQLISKTKSIFNKTLLHLPYNLTGFILGYRYNIR